MKFVDEFVAYCRDFTGCPEIFLRWSAILALSATAGDKHVLRRGDWDVRPNLWILLLGTSSSYKSTGLSAIQRILYEISPDMLAAQEYSHEKFLEDMAVNPHRVCIYDEAQSFFKMLAQPYNAPLKALYLSLWSRRTYRREIKGKEGTGEVVTITNPYLCWGGASTPIQVSEHLSNGSSDLLSGFFPRFVLVPFFDNEKTIDDPPPADPQKRSALISRLKYLSLSGERTYTYTEEALKIKSKWLRGLERRMKACEDFIIPFYKKMRDEHFHKLAMLSAFERESTDIELEDISNAAGLLAPIEMGWPDVLSVITEKDWDRTAKRVEEFIAHKKVVDRKDILRGVRGVKAQKLSAILDGMKQDGQIDMAEESSGGRKRNVISWVN